MDILSLVDSRRSSLGDSWRTQISLQTHSTLMNRIDYSYQLEDHKGCVNCLQWNEDGSLLASGSDDLEVKVWSVYEKRLAASMNSGHTGNIFSVKFMPFSGDLSLVSGAEDRGVHLHDLTTLTTTKIWSCCTGRVKRLAVSRQSPYIVWSASEDGCVRQFDVRENHTCVDEGKCRNVLIDLKKTCGANANCKCIDVNPVRHEQIAVGAYDPYIRLYDTRILSLTRPSSEPVLDRPDPGCIGHFSPGHISQSFRKSVASGHPPNNSIAATFVTFGPSGNELLANLSSEQVYLFSTVNFQPVLSYSLSSDSNPLLVNKPSYSPVPLQTIPVTESDICADILALRDKGNILFRDSKYTEAIEYYSMAISLNDSWYILYSNRATTYLKRNWCGDVYDALKDTERALLLNPQHQKSLQRRIKCLKLLGWFKEAFWYINEFARLFPAENEYIDNMIKEMKKLEESHSNGYTRPVGWESHRQQNASDYCRRFIGHCNTHTDIKEATFLGENGEYVGAGSDDGNVFIWNKQTGNLVKILSADDSIVNCVQWNPRSCSLATSGIESVIKIWEPNSCKVNSDSGRVVRDVHKVCELNQNRMRLDPFEIMLMRLGLRVGQSFTDAVLENHRHVHHQEEVTISHQQCRQS